MDVKRKKRKEREKSGVSDPLHTDEDVDSEDSAKEKKHKKLIRKRKKQKRKVSDPEDDLPKKKKQKKQVDPISESESDGETPKVDSETDPDDDSHVRYTALNWSSSSAESEYDGLCIPNLLAAQHFPADVTQDEVMAFFNNKPADIHIRDEGVVDERQCLILFRSQSETREGLKMKGKTLRGNAIFVARQGNNRDIFCVSGFNDQLPPKEVKKELRKTFNSRGKVINVFVPTNSKTGRCLGFGYIYLESARENVYASTTIGAHQVDIRRARPKRCFQAEMEGKKIDLKDGENPDKTALKRTLLPLHTLIKTSQKTFSWRKERPDTTAEHYTQNINDCWAVGLSRAYTALRNLLEQPGPVLTREDLLNGVDIAHQVSGDGIDNIKNAIPFMSMYVKEMRIHHRPRGDDETAFEDFERKLVELLKTSPVMVTLECVPSWNSFSGQGIYSPPDIDCYLRTFEKFPVHCPLLTGYDIINGIEVWELQESNGETHGNEGFVWIKRHKCLIKSVVELKLEISQGP